MHPTRLRIRRPLLMLILCTLVAAALAAQDPPQGPRWAPLNRPEVVVNEDLLTRTQLVRQIDRARREQPVTTREEELQQQAEIVRLAVEQLVLRQAGEDLGQPKEAIERVLDNVRDQQMERSGGLQAYSLQLAADEVSSIEKRQELEGDIYSWTYTRVVTGREPGKDGRLIADRFVRPGQRRRLFEYMERTGQGLRQIGGKPATFVLQQLILAPEDGEDMESVRRRALALRARALGANGAEPEDFNALVEQHGAQKGSASLSTDVAADVVGAISAEVAEFFERAGIGDVSPVFPVREARRGAIEAWRMVRVLETKPAEVPDYYDVEIQRRVERVAQRQLDERRQSDAVSHLLESAYVWSPDLERAKAEKQAAEKQAADEEAARKAADEAASTPPAPEAPPTAGPSEAAKPDGGDPP